MNRLGILGLYLFLFIILLLSGLYFSKIFFVIFVIYLCIPLISFIHLFIVKVFLRYHQEFSSEHPLKGEDVSYTFSIKNESVFLSGPIFYLFKLSLERIKGEAARNSILLRSGESYTKDRVLNCPVRGVYTVGLESLKVTDFFGFFRLRLPVWHRTFYVYPRILSVIPKAFINQSTGSETIGSGQGNLDDVTLYRNLTEYRRGEPVQHIAWKKFASVGEPYLKEFDTTSQPGVSIYLDTRRIGALSTESLITEDCSVEILVALVKYFTAAGVRVYVNAEGWENFFFDGYDEESFLSFHRKTIQLRFTSNSSPVNLLKADRYDNRFNPSLLLFVTHILDPEIITLLEGSRRNELPSGAVFNFSGYCENDSSKVLQILDTIRERGGTAVPVWDAETIKEDLMS